MESAKNSSVKLVGANSPEEVERQGLEEEEKWIYDVGIYTFPWHMTWWEQLNCLKIEFWKHMKELFSFALSEHLVDDYMNSNLKLA